MGSFRTRDTKTGQYHGLIAAVLVLVSAAALFLALRHRPYTTAQGAEDVIRSMVEGHELPSKVLIRNGDFGNLTREQAEGLYREILRPAFEGCKLVDVQQDVA